MPRDKRNTLFDDQSAYLDRFGLVLLLTVLAIVALALVDLSAPSGDLAATLAALGTSVLVGVTLLLAMRASGLRLRWRRLADVLVAVVIAVIAAQIVYDLVADTAHPASQNGTRSLTLVVLSLLAPLVVIRRLAQHRTVTTGTLLGAVSAYLLLPIAFCYAFLAIDGLQSTPFFGQPEPTTSFMYFSLTTVTTVGYGDLTAAGSLGRLIATSEAVAGQVYLVTFVAMLVGLRAQHWAASRGQREGATAGGEQASQD